jgi:HEAT repeat protein
MIAQMYRRGVVLCVLSCGSLMVFCTAVRAEPHSTAELVAATKSADAQARLKAIHELGVSRDAAAVPALVKLLHSDSPVERGYAARALRMIGAPAKSAAKDLIDLLADPEAGVRRQATAALAAIRPGPKVSVPIFIKLMQDSDPGVRMRVMNAVADAKGAAVPALVEALNDDAACYWACVILRDIGPDAKGACPALVEKLKDPRPDIRREALLTLAAIGSTDCIEKLVPLLKDEFSRTPATFALGALGQIPPDAESIVRANVNGDDKLLGTVSLWALARVHPKDMKLKREAITQLVARLSDKDPFVRAAAARALASLPPSPEIAIPIFEKALADGDETTTSYMLDALARMGPKAVPRLINALQYKSVRPQVAFILGQIGPPAAPATEALAKLVNGEDPNASIEAAHALAKIGPGAKAAVPALIEALSDAEGKPMHAAAYALGRIGPDAAAAEPALLDVIDRHDNSRSLISAWAIVQIRGPSAETAAKVMSELLVGLESSLPQSRKLAAETLGSLGANARSAVPQLKRATQDSDESVRAAAGKALESIRG